jgi:hypothetical protein
MIHLTLLNHISILMSTGKLSAIAHRYHAVLSTLVGTGYLMLKIQG